MSLTKAIKHKKEKRKDYREKGEYAKSVSSHCRNHGRCEWCKNNRLHSSEKRKMKYTGKGEEDE